MADSAVPFALGASNVPLVEDLVDVPVGQSTTIEILLSGLLADDVPEFATLAIKAAPSDSDVASTTILKTITQALSAAGVITATDDPTVWRATFALTQPEGVRINARTTYTYSVVANVSRDAVPYSRMVQRGAIRTTLFSIDDGSPVADGTIYADGSLYATGFYN